MKIQYCLSCYPPDSYLFSIPLPAPAAWLKKVLHRKDLINGEPLQKEEFWKLARRLWKHNIEVAWHDRFEYYLEGINLPEPPRKLAKPSGTQKRKLVRTSRKGRQPENK